MSSPHAYIISMMVTINYNVKIRDIEPLVEGHWTTSSHEMKFSFLEASLTQYLNGKNAPVKSDKVSMHAQWKAINLHIIGTLGRHITPTLSQELEEDMSTAEAWLLLKKRTQQDSIFAKLNAMHVARHTKFSHNMLIIDTVSKLKNLLASIYECREAPT